MKATKPRPQQSPAQPAVDVCYVPVHMPEDPADAIEDCLFYILTGQYERAAGLYRCLARRPGAKRIIAGFVRTLLCLVVEADDLLYEAGIIYTEAPDVPKTRPCENCSRGRRNVWPGNLEPGPLKKLA